MSCKGRLSVCDVWSTCMFLFSHCVMQCCLVQGERLSHAVGCAFAACLERKQKREKECGVTATFDASRTTFTREGSFRVTTATEQAEREEIMRQMPDAKGTRCNLNNHLQRAEPALRPLWGLKLNVLTSIPSLEPYCVQIIFPDPCQFTRWKMLLNSLSIFPRLLERCMWLHMWNLLLLCFVRLLYGREHCRYHTKRLY